MRNLLKHLAVGSLLLFATTACADLEVPNLNDPDAARSLSLPGDVVSLIGGSFNNWFAANYNFNAAGLAISNAAFQHNPPWANAGMETYGRLPRVGFNNSIADGDYAYLTRPWFWNYRAIAAVADGLKALERPEIQAGLTPAQVGSAKAFGKFVQGVTHGHIAVLFSEGFIVDETTDLAEAQEPVGYAELMSQALSYLDEAVSLSSGGNWTLPLEWMRAPLTGPELARVARSFKARYRAMNARTWAERQAVTWDAVIADIDAGITSDFTMDMNWDVGWYNALLDYGSYFGWSQAAYPIYGMADQSGNYQLWNSTALGSKSHTIGGKEILIVTPDNRFPPGATVAAQRASETPTRQFRVNRPGETGGTWARPDRGSWRWSWYKHNAQEAYGLGLEFNQPVIRLAEMRLLKAEALFHKNDRAGAAALVNQTRTAAGLNATDANGTNTSCVPKLPDGTCGGLFEMLKWEKRMNSTFIGPSGVGWYFDGRGWGDLWKDTFLHLPIPCAEAQVLQLLPCGTFGGPGGEGGAPLSNYKWNGEG
jgi:hypothetical protein